MVVFTWGTAKGEKTERNGHLEEALGKESLVSSFNLWAAHFHQAALVRVGHSWICKEKGVNGEKTAFRRNTTETDKMRSFLYFGGFHTFELHGWAHGRTTLNRSNMKISSKIFAGVSNRDNLRCVRSDEVWSPNISRGSQATFHECGDWSDMYQREGL